MLLSCCHAGVHKCMPWKANSHQIALQQAAQDPSLRAVKLFVNRKGAELEASLMEQVHLCTMWAHMLHACLWCALQT